MLPNAPYDCRHRPRSLVHGGYTSQVCSTHSVPAHRKLGRRGRNHRKLPSELPAQVISISGWSLPRVMVISIFTPLLPEGERRDDIATFDVVAPNQAHIIPCPHIILAACIQNLSYVCYHAYHSCPSISAIGRYNEQL
jgi:hypothetical protein